MRPGNPLDWCMNKGEWHPAAKLTDEDVVLIRACRDERNRLKRLAKAAARRAEKLAQQAKLLTAAKVAEKFEVSHTTVFEIWKNKRRPG